MPTDATLGELLERVDPLKVRCLTCFAKINERCKSRLEGWTGYHPVRHSSALARAKAEMRLERLNAAEEK